LKDTFNKTFGLKSKWVSS